MTLLVRRVVGSSMAPTLLPGAIVVAFTRPRRLKAGDVVIVRHGGTEKIKRLHAVDAHRVFITGDNQAASTDSRHFGWLARTDVLARVCWPRIAMPSKS